MPYQLIRAQVQLPGEQLEQLGPQLAVLGQSQVAFGPEIAGEFKDVIDGHYPDFGAIPVVVPRQGDFPGYELPLGTLYPTEVDQETRTFAASWSCAQPDAAIIAFEQLVIAQPGWDPRNDYYADVDFPVLGREIDEGYMVLAAVPCIEAPIFSRLPAGLPPTGYQELVDAIPRGGHIGEGFTISGLTEFFNTILSQPANSL